MKLETILNAYGKAQKENGNLSIVFSKYAICATQIDYYKMISNRRIRQAEKFKMRLMRVLKQHDGQCSFSFTDAYYEDDLRHCCLACGGEMQIVRPGKWQCPNCE